MKIVIPMAGFGTRLKPFTLSRPKALVSVAGQAVLDYVLEQFRTVPNPAESEYFFILNPQHGEQIHAHMQAFHPEKQVCYLTQTAMRGQSDAVWQARRLLSGPTIVAFADTLIETDFSFLRDEPRDIVGWVKRVEDPRSMGVVELNPFGQVERLVEKPDNMRSRLAIVGAYYFKKGEDLIAAIAEQISKKNARKNEFYLADAINLMLFNGARMGIQPVKAWLDAGTPPNLLATNRFMLANGRDNSAELVFPPGVGVIPPVRVHPSAVIESSVIGPNVSIGARCRVKNAVVRDSILEAEAQVEGLLLEGSILGEGAALAGTATRACLGDYSTMA